MRLFRKEPPDSRTGFRLPRELLASIDAVCNEQDLTRSQVFRKCVTQFIKSVGDNRNVQNLGIAQMTQVEQHSGWMPELYDRLERRK
jgi:metal-responsive CopG/Arc/MetJ family transcriptional regulator